MEDKNTGKAEHSFSPLQIGSIAEAIDPVDIGTGVAEVISALEGKPDKIVVPVEKDGAVLGVVFRQTLEKLVHPGENPSPDLNLEGLLIPVLGTVEASAYIDAVMEQFLKSSQGDDASWFVVRHRDRYLGVVGLRKIIEYTNAIQVRDLIRAGEIQQNLLDKSQVADKRLEVLLYNKMAHELGGDFYRVFRGGKDRYLIGCFDVAGKNISGALATMALGACFSALELFKFEGGAEKTTQFINSLVRDVNPPGIFVTAVLFYVDFTTMTVKIHNCGFSPVLIFVPQADNRITFKAIQPSLPPLGIQEELDVDTGQIVPLGPGLRITAYSDGLTDMTDIHGERYGEDKTFTLLKKFHIVPQNNLRKLIDREIGSWIGEASLADDVTLVDIRFI
ncbi:Stage II sporulation protein E [Treponema primitia ZAS-2]|uniref:Stage II sporulation protein E n=1 Tax=Treponema primitia (strain ATCC BAA-887 / DSM 12427 / ZAS-2) TaxID=545694 RepID=F5YNR3_TREPZ|nr:PP2C family protein-serine/threonine phosphatase [Treponema primitia]AEF86793.1 Stage II sporulation protein E [Treponema primitia ZAS-2]